MINSNDTYRDIQKFSKADFDRMVWLHDGIESAVIMDDSDCFSVDPKRYTKTQVIKLYSAQWDDNGSDLDVIYTMSDESEFTVTYER